MIYDNKSGYNVIQEGKVVIDGVYHFVCNKFVKCDPSLNSRSWNTTKAKGVCPICKPHIKLELKQLRLFE